MHHGTTNCVGHLQPRWEANYQNQLHVALAAINRVLAYTFRSSFICYNRPHFKKLNNELSFFNNLVMVWYVMLVNWLKAINFCTKDQIVYHFIILNLFILMSEEFPQNPFVKISIISILLRILENALRYTSSKINLTCYKTSTTSRILLKDNLTKYNTYLTNRLGC